MSAKTGKNEMQSIPKRSLTPSLHELSPFPPPMRTHAHASLPSDGIPTLLQPLINPISHLGSSYKTLNPKSIILRHTCRYDEYTAVEGAAVLIQIICIVYNKAWLSMILKNYLKWVYCTDGIKQVACSESTHPWWWSYHDTLWHEHTPHCKSARDSIHRLLQYTEFTCRAVQEVWINVADLWMITFCDHTTKTITGWW